MSKEDQPENPRPADPEHGSSSYQRAARFVGEQPAWRAYHRTERLIARSTADISAYRFQISRIWHVAVVAEAMPDSNLQRRIEAALHPGEPVTLPSKVAELLLARHRQAMVSGLPWIEGHYDPGKRLE